MEYKAGDLIRVIEPKFDIDCIVKIISIQKSITKLKSIDLVAYITPIMGKTGYWCSPNRNEHLWYLSNNQINKL